MPAVKTIRSRTVALPATNIDTDQIIPARFLTSTSKAGFGKHLFADWRYDAAGNPKPDFVLNRPEAKGAAILVAGRNIGCGSSREHAPWALQDFGFQAVVSTEFADIFRTNCLKNGLLPVVVDEQTHAWLLANPGVEVSIDVESTTLTLPDGTQVKFPLEGFARFCLLNGVDELGFLLSQNAAIERLRAKPPMKAHNCGHRGRWHRSRSRRRRRSRARTDRQAIRPRIRARRSAVRRHRHRPHRRSAAAAHARHLPRGRRRVVRRHRRPEVGSVGAGAPRAGTAAPAPRARRVRQPAAHQAAPGAARRLGAQAGNSRRRGPGVRARTHRRHLLRRQDPHPDAGHGSLQLLRQRNRAHHARRRPPRHAAAQEDRLHRQVQRARDLATVARGRLARRSFGISRGGPRAHAGRLRRHAPAEAPARLRRACSPRTCSATS